VLCRCAPCWPVHIYAGVLGPILGVLHSGHRFESPLGIALDRDDAHRRREAAFDRTPPHGPPGTPTRELAADARRNAALAYERTSGELAKEPAEAAAALRPVRGVLLAAGRPSFFVADPAARAGRPTRQAASERFGCRSRWPTSSAPSSPTRSSGDAFGPVARVPHRHRHRALRGSWPSMSGRRGTSGSGGSHEENRDHLRGRDARRAGCRSRRCR
jgi:hypothetical protein